MRLIHSEWDFFCSKIDSKKCVTVSELPDIISDQPWIAIKHDVETNLKRALEIAEIEAKYSIRATYFIQSYLLNGGGALLQAIADLGHEVTYHYDVLDANLGNINLAKLEFQETLNKFKSMGFPVVSVCPHGNPLMKRTNWDSNKDFFRNKEIASQFPELFDLVVQGKDKIKSDYTYISDAGYGFKIISDIAGKNNKLTGDVKLEGIESLIEMACNTNPNSLVISTHPHRWVSSKFTGAFLKTRFLVFRKVASVLAKSKFLKFIMSKFYFLAKKI